MTVSGATTIGQLVQNLGGAYTQSVTKLYEVGTPRVYFIGGRTNGQGQIGRVLGPAVLQTAFYQQYGNICNISRNNLNFSFRSNCGTTAVNTNYSLGLVLVMQVGFSVAAADMLINESVGFMFSSLNIG